MPVPAYIDEPLPEEMPDSALAWDGERYSREEFCEYYGDEVLFYQAQQLTYFCRQYLSTWFDYSRQQEDHTALHLVLRLLKRQELRDNLALGDILLRYWYRAMVLRVEYLGAGPDGHLCTDAECQAMDRMVLQWAVDYDTGERPAMKARQLQRLYWQKWFGHKKRLPSHWPSMGSTIGCELSWRSTRLHRSTTVMHSELRLRARVGNTPTTRTHSSRPRERLGSGVPDFLDVTASTAVNCADPLRLRAGLSASMLLFRCGCARNASKQF